MDKKLALRRIFPQLKSHLEAAEITVIIGPRQVGKTTLVFQLKEYLLSEKIAQEKQIYYFNLDVVSDQTIFRNQSDFVQFLRNRINSNNKLYVFVDEVQRIENCGLFFKGVYDLQLPVKLVLTGSSSLEIRSKIVESLTGRKRLFKLLPLSFSEYLSFCEKDLLPFLSRRDEYAKEKLMRRLYQFIIFGGYPKVITEEDSSKKAVYLEEIFTSYVEKDVVGFLRIKDSYNFSKLVKILAEETGNLFNVERISQELHIKNQTIRHYLDILEYTFVAYRISPFFRSTRTEIRKMPKIYFGDNGIRNFGKDYRDFVEKSFLERTDKGSLLENFIFSELIKLEKEKINFWRTKDDAEVDFILTKKGETIPVEVKAVSLVGGKVSRSFLSFRDKYKPRAGIIVNLAYQGMQKIKGTDVHYLLPYELPDFIDRM